MKHLFSSGEVLYKKNLKMLEQGSLYAYSLHYEELGENTTIEAQGSLNEKKVCVRFKVQKSCFDELNFKAKLKILMQSDLLLADWETYDITDLEQV